MDKEYILVTELKDINSIKEKLKHFIQEQTKRYHKRFEERNLPCHLFAEIWLGGHPFSMPNWRLVKEPEISKNKFYFLDSKQKIEKILEEKEYSSEILGWINTRALSKEDINRAFGKIIVFIPLDVEDLESVFVPSWEKRFVAVHIDKILKYFDDKKIALEIIKNKNSVNKIEDNYLIGNILLLFDKMGFSESKPLVHSHGVGIELDFSYDSNVFLERSISDEEYKRCIKDRFVFTIQATYDEAYLYFCLLAKFFVGKIYAGDRSSTLWLKEWVQEVESITDIEKQIINQKTP